MIIIKINLDTKNLEFIGKGTQGEVYKIDSKKCIKIFKKKKDYENELESLLMTKGDLHFPVLYEFNSNYIIREYVDGIELNEYLSKNALTFDITNKIIELYEAMVKVGFLRKDAAIFHILITPSNELKLIDTAKAMKKKSTIPNLLISGLEELGYKEDFFNFLKDSKPDYYLKWKKYSKKKYKKVI